MYFSGNHGWSLPEVLLADSPPCVMLSFWNMSRAVGGFDARSMTRFLSHATGLNLHKPPKGAASFYMKTPNGVQPRFRGEGVPARIGSLFIDSGAHSLYNKEADTGNPRKDAVSQRDKYQFFDLKKGSEFRKFLESYVAFIRKYRKAIDFYVTLDAIYNPEKTWEITCLLEEEYGLKPVPVIHCHAPIKWIAQYIERGHRLIGIGGLGQGITRKAFLSWGDKVFHFLCPSPDKLPVVRTHGFAMTSWKLLMRYPWWSVDSASWIKIAAYGRILVPHRRDGRFVFNVPPYIIGVSQESKDLKIRDHHVLNLSKDTQAIVEAWLNRIGTPLGGGEEWGVTTHYEARARANLMYFYLLSQRLEYPRPFQYRDPDQGFGLVDPGTADMPKLTLKPEQEDSTRMYFSGMSGGGAYPETLIHEKEPEVMLSFYDLKDKTPGATAWQRFNKHRESLP